MKKFTYNRWLIGLIVIGLAAALAIGLSRNKIEKENMTLEMAIDYEGLKELAQVEGIPVDEVLSAAKERGITSLAVYETNLKKLTESGKVTATAGADVIRSYGNGTLADSEWCSLVERGQVSADCVYVSSMHDAVLKEVQQDMSRRFGSERVAEMQVSGKKVVVVKANYEKAVKVHLGMPSDEMKAVNDAGFYVVSRPTNYEKVTKEDIESFFDRIRPYNVSSIVFSDKEALGAPKLMEVTADNMKRDNYLLGMIEHPLQLQFFKQEGLMELAKAMDYHAARLYSIPKDEQAKMKIAQASERWVTTDEERNIRINLLRTFEKPETGLTLLETNYKYLADTKEKLQAKGFVFDKAKAYQSYYPSKLLLILITLGAVAAGVLYISLIYPLAARYQYMLVVLLGALAIVPYIIGTGNLSRIVTALAAACLFPAIAMISQLDRWRSSEYDEHASLIKIIGSAFAAIFITGAMSFVGAAYVGGVLADVTYLLEVNIFRGVKLTFVMPILLVMLGFLRRFNLFEGSDYSGSLWEQIKKILNTPIYVKSLLAFGLAAVAALVFIGRSGHTAGVPVPGFELKLRAFLEQALYARPRSKEFLIGHPIFMLTVMAVYRKWPRILFFVMVITATIGMGSLVETFAHMRTPIFMSFIRGVNGLVLGSILGAAAMVAAHLLYKLSSYIGRDTAKHE